MEPTDIDSEGERIEISKVNNLNLENTTFRELFGINAVNDDNVYHNYFSIQSMTNALQSCRIVSNFNVIDDILNIIASYCGTVQWSDTEKSSQLIILNSLDNKISYAILPKKNTTQHFMRHNIYLNEWINIFENMSNNKFIYRYIFKYYSNKDFGRGPVILGGFATNKYENALQGPSTDVNMIGCDKSGHSLSWWTYGADACRIFYKDGSQTGAWMHVDWHSFSLSKLKTNDATGKCYFLIEINLIDNKITIYCSAFRGKEKYQQCDIPKTLLQEMKHEPIRIGFTFCPRPNKESLCGFGIGLVANN